MKYSEEFVKNIVNSVLSGKSRRDIERFLGIPRKTIGNWVKRILVGLPTRFKRSAKRVKNGD